MTYTDTMRAGRWDCLCCDSPLALTGWRPPYLAAILHPAQYGIAGDDPLPADPHCFRYVSVGAGSRNRRPGRTSHSSRLTHG